MFRAVVQTDELEEAVDVVLPRHLRPAHGGRQPDVLAHGEVGHEVARRPLPDESDPLRPILGEGFVLEEPEVATLHLDDAGRRAVEAADEVQDRRLAGAARAHDGEELALVHVEVDAGQRHDPHVPDPVHLVGVAEAHERVLSLRPVAIRAHLVLDHSASPRSTPVTEARSIARADSASASAVAPRIAARAIPSDVQSIRNTGGG